MLRVQAVAKLLERRRASAGARRRRGQGRLNLISATGLCIFTVFGALAFATALKPHGYQQASGLAFAVLFGVIVFLVLLLILRSLFGRFIPGQQSRVGYLALAAALGLLIAVAAVRSLTVATAARGRGGLLAQEEQDFQNWTPTAIPLIIRYRDAVRVDAPLARRPRAWQPAARLRERVNRVEGILLGLQRSTGPIVASSPMDLRAFMPLLRRSLGLAVAAQQAYAAGLSRHAPGMPSQRAAGQRRFTAPLRRGTRLLRTSEEAMAAFTEQVNAVGAQLSAGRKPAAPGRHGGRLGDRKTRSLNARMRARMGVSGERQRESHQLGSVL